MSKQPIPCKCEKPILRERSEWKGASESYCDRCKRPLTLKTTKRAA
jgi:predicted SprT family Zn-dependent metalloprotease